MAKRKGLETDRPLTMHVKRACTIRVQPNGKRRVSVDAPKEDVDIVLGKKPLRSGPLKAYIDRK